MVASRQVEIPFYRAFFRQQQLRSNVLAQVFGRRAILFVRKCFVPAAKRVGADLLGLALPYIADDVSGGKVFKTAAKSVEDKP